MYSEARNSSFNTKCIFQIYHGKVQGDSSGPHILCGDHFVLPLLQFNKGMRSSAVELWTHYPKVVSENPMWANVLCLWAKHFTLTCSSWLRCINGYRLKLGSLSRLCGRLATLSQQHYKLSSLAQLLVKRRWAPLDALKSVPTQFTFIFT